MKNRNQKWIGDFIDYYFSFDSESRKIALELKEKYIPEKLYRYRSFNPEKKDQTFKEITCQELFMAKATALNDPFDCVGFCDMEKAIEKLPNDRIDDIISTFDILESVKEIPRNELISAISGFRWLECIHRLMNKYCSDTDIKEMDKALLIIRITLENESYEIGRMAKDRTVICSFTETNTNMPMWNHYASEYKGICIEYCMANFSKGSPNRNCMFPVEYRDELFDMSEYASVYRKKIHPDLGLRIAICKHSDWQYEKEWRYAFDVEKCMDITNGLFDQKVIFPAVSAVYMGYNIDKVHEDKLAEICSERGIPLKKMQLGLNGVDFTNRC